MQMVVQSYLLLFDVESYNHKLGDESIKGTHLALVLSIAAALIHAIVEFMMVGFRTKTKTQKKLNAQCVAKKSKTSMKKKAIV